MKTIVVNVNRFGEHGRDGLQELIRAPVVEICEASAQVAMLIARTFSVSTYEPPDPKPITGWPLSLDVR